MPRKRDIEAAIAAYNRSDPKRLRLPADAVRLLAIMFPTDTVYRRSVRSLGLEGFTQYSLAHLLKDLVDTGFLSKEPGRRGALTTYRLHLPPVRR